MKLYEIDPERGQAPWRVVGQPQYERVLHVHLETHIDPQKSMVKALQDLGPNHYEIIRWSPYNFHESQYARRQETLLRHVKSNKPTLVFMQLQMPGVIGPETLQRLKEISPESTVVMWCGDIGRVNGPHDTDEGRWAYETAKHLDLSLYTSMDQVRAHRQRGMANAAYLQIGYDDWLFRPGPDEQYGEAYDCVFFGQNYKEEQWKSVPEHEIQLRRDAVAMCRKLYGERFGLFGQNWPDASMHMMKPEDTALAYRRSRTALSISLTSQYDRYSSDRLHRAMACGTPTFVKKFDDMGSWGLRDGVNCMFWDKPQDLDYRLGIRREDLRRIGTAGATLMADHHTWHVRMLEMLALVSKVRPNGYKPALFKPEF